MRTSLTSSLAQDDIDLSQVAKGFHEEAKAAGVPMLISTGMHPSCLFPLPPPDI